MNGINGDGCEEESNHTVDDLEEKESDKSPSDDENIPTTESDNQTGDAVTLDSILVPTVDASLSEKPTESPPEDKASESKVISDQLVLSIDKGAEYYLLNADWYRDWDYFQHYDSERPGPVDNTILLGPDGALRNAIGERRDYRLVTREGWDLIMRWYGGGPPIARNALNTIIDLHGIRMNIRRSSDETFKKPIRIQKSTTVGDLLAAFANEFGVEKSTLRLWDYYQNKRYALLAKESEKLDQCNITEDQAMMLEEKGADGKFAWPNTPETTSSSSSYNYSTGYSSYSYSMVDTITSAQAPDAPGLVGLSNLGNTCFMNSIIQSLNASTALRKIFMSDDYQSELNLDNPLGHEGKVANGFRALLKLMYSGDGRIIAPRGFKKMIGDICPQFQGYNQHDSHELLNFLLDGLHEDLNRIMSKPFTETVEANGRPDEEVAKEALDTFKLRNDSCIADLCSGQFKSTVICPTCNYISKTFDVYFSISLPLAKETALEQQLTLQVISRSCPKKSINVQVPRAGPMYHLRAAASRVLGLAMDKLLIYEVFSHSFHKVFDDFDPIESILKGDDLIVCEVDDGEVPSQSFEWNPVPPREEWEMNMSDTEEPGEELDENNVQEEPEESVPPPPSDSARPPPAAEEEVSYLNPFRVGDVFDGGYQSGHRTSPCRLTVLDIKPGDEVEAVFDCLTSASTQATFCVAGKFDQRTGHIDLNPVGWISSTARLSMVGIRLTSSFRKNGTVINMSQDGEDSEDSDTEMVPMPPAKPEDHYAMTGSVMHQSCGFILFKRAKKDIDQEWDSLPELVNGEGEPIRDDFPERGRGSICIRVVHKALGGYYGMTNVKIGSPLVVTVSDLAKDSEVHAKVVEAIESQGADMELPFKILHCSTYFDETSTYYGNRTGELRADQDDPNSPYFYYIKHQPKGYRTAYLVVHWGKATEDQVFGRETDVGNNQDQNESMMSLHDCLNLFSVTEKLSQENSWYCSKCKDFKEATKQMQIWSVPPVLCLHLKRFSVEATSFWVDKLDTAVDIPLHSLDLAEYTLSETAPVTTYTLVAVSNHFGGTGGGHYTAHVRNETTGEWYECDDSHVSRCMGAPVDPGAAYVLFYLRDDYVPSHWTNTGASVPNSEADEAEEDAGNSGTAQSMLF